MTEPSVPDGGVGGFWRATMLLPLSVLLATVVGAGLFFALREPPIHFIEVLAGPTEGAYYRVASRIRHVLVDGGAPLVDDVRVVTSAGSSENAALLGEQHNNRLALVQADASLAPTTRLIMPLYQEALYVLAVPDDGEGVSPLFRDYLLARERRVFLGEAGSGTREIAERVLDFFGVAEQVQQATPRLSRAQAVDALVATLAGTATSPLDAVVLLDTYPSDQVDRLVRAGAVLLSLAAPTEAHNEVETLALRYPVYQPFTLPSRAYGELPPAETITVSAYLVADAAMDSSLARDITQRLLLRRYALSQPLEEVDPVALPALEGLRERYDPGVFLTPFHDGAESYYRRNEPSFISENAELIALFITVGGLMFSGGIYLLQAYRLSRKNRIDRYYRRIRGISDQLRTVPVERLVRMREELDQVREDAFQDLIDERVEADESFLIFQNFMQGQVRAIEARLEDLGRTAGAEHHAQEVHP